MGVVKRTEAICDRIVAAVSNGTPLAVVCREIGISTDAVYDWEKVDDNLKRRIACARADGHDVIANRARETARGQGDSTADVARDKLIIETDLKLLAKWSPRYAERIVHAGDADAPMQTKHTITLVATPPVPISGTKALK